MEKKVQKFLRGQRVRVASKLPEYKSHFESGCEAIIDHSGFNPKDYALFLLHPYFYYAAWYEEDDLTLVDPDIEAGINTLKIFNGDKYE